MQEAFRLIKAGDKAEAARILTPILEDERDNADAWWLMAHAVEKPSHVRQALEHVLRLRPDDAKARAMLDKLPQTPPKPAPKPRTADPLAQSFGSGRMDDDPFAGVDDGDPFASVDNADPFADVKDDRPAHRREPNLGKPAKTGSSGGNPLTIALAVVGVLALVVCGVCALTGIGGLSLFGQAAQSLSAEMQQYTTVMPDGSIVVNNMGSYDSVEDAVIGDLTVIGPIDFGQQVQGYIGDAFDNHAYTFDGSAGDVVNIDLVGTSDNFTPEFQIYDSGINRIASEMGAFDDAIYTSVTLANSGTYTLVVSGIASEGSYDLKISR
jgi:hypothetical protein